MGERYDVIVVGGGVVGCHCARELSRYRLRVLLLEKESDVCSGASKANSGIVHPCTSPRPGSWKARLCFEGNRLMATVCEELGVEYRRNGSLTIALADSELRVLRALKRRGEANGETDLRLLGEMEARRLEPLLGPEVRAALLAPSAAVVDPFMLTIAAAENAVANGVDVRLDTEVMAVRLSGSVVVGVETTQGFFAAPYVVNAAGLYADGVAASAGDRRLRITPRRGDYYLLDKMDLVQHTLFPIPSPTSKGILVTPTAHGNVLLGPTSLPTSCRDFPPVMASGLDEVRRQVQRLVPGIDLRQCIAVFAGVRPSGSRDFDIGMAPGAHGLLNLAGIESPGLTAAPAIARAAVAILSEAGLRLVPNPAFDPIRPERPRLAQMPLAERAEWIRRDPRYGRVVCRCEGVTEGEIVAAIHAPVPARTLDAIKRRTRAMAGRCQGGFDLPWIVEILARELGIQPWEVTKNGPGSECLVEWAGQREQGRQVRS